MDIGIIKLKKKIYLYMYIGIIKMQISQRLEYLIMFWMLDLGLKHIKEVFPQFISQRTTKHSGENFLKIFNVMLVALVHIGPHCCVSVLISIVYCKYQPILFVDTRSLVPAPTPALLASLITNTDNVLLDILLCYVSRYFEPCHTI